LNRRSAFGISGRLTKTFTALAQVSGTNLCLRAPPAFLQAAPAGISWRGSLEPTLLMSKYNSH
ncbi:MAG: hypothetical protein MPJ79_06410, partial [Alphaproteobacteria bacterium]|nr:hypothetical protein [Alphaproteobacteria bacterium]